MIPNDIVERLTRNSVHVCGVFMLRPSYLTGSQWMDFWTCDGPDWQRQPIDYDHHRVLLFGAVIERPPKVLSLEWENFWADRTSRRPLHDTNHRAVEASNRRWPWSKSENRRP